ncbi:MAG: SRPBCC domain-containing protein [Actinomycetota bacterium]
MPESERPEARIEHTIAAPIDRVWSAFVEPAEFAGWYGPPGAVIPVCEMDVAVGGRRFVGMEMTTPNGARQMWFVGEFVELSSPTRLAYTEVLADADGRALPPEASGMPPEMTSTEVVVELAEADAGGTDLVVRHIGILADSPGAMGWRMAIDQLDERLTG